MPSDHTRLSRTQKSIVSPGKPALNKRSVQATPCGMAQHCTASLRAGPLPIAITLLRSECYLGILSLLNRLRSPLTAFLIKQPLSQDVRVYLTHQEVLRDDVLLIHVAK